MKKVRNILLLVLMVFMAVPNLVFAEEYKVGDLVEVINQTGGDSQQFYIMATEKEFEIMRLNYCKVPGNNDSEECTGYDEIDENFSYGNGAFSAEWLFDEQISDYVVLISKKVYYKDFVYDAIDDGYNLYNNDSYCYFDNRKEFSYICLKMNADEQLLSEYFGYFKYGDLIELLYSNNDNLTYYNSGFYGNKKINNIPSYLSNYKNALLYYEGGSVLRYSKITGFENNTLTARVETIALDEGETATFDVYLTILMSKENIRHVVQEEPNAEEPKVEENVTKEELKIDGSETKEESITTTAENEDVKNPSTGDINIVFIMLGLVSFAGLALIANKKFRKIKNN